MRQALVLVDLQNDFMPGGALAVPEGDRVVPLANHLARTFDLVVATQDWHPADHGSFAAGHPGRQPGEVIDLHGLPQVLWPVHCVQDTPGADFHPDLDRSRITRIIHKGTDPQVDSYSGFYDNGHRHATGLGDFLKEKGVTGVFVLGLATDYCVKATAIDAVRLGYTTWLVEDACRGVGLHPGDIPAAIQDMIRAGVALTRSGQLMPPEIESLTPHPGPYGRTEGSVRPLQRQIPGRLLEESGPATLQTDREGDRKA